MEKEFTPVGPKEVFAREKLRGQILGPELKIQKINTESSNKKGVKKIISHRAVKF